MEIDKVRSVLMVELKDPGELAAARSQRARFDRNSAWLQANVPEVYSKHRGKVICVAGGALRG